MIRKSLKQICILCGQWFSFLAPVVRILSLIRLYIYTGYKKNSFNHVGTNILVCPFCRRIEGGDIGDSCTFGKGLWLSVITKHGKSNFRPLLKIGNNCNFGDYNHIAAINRIEIGNGVLTGQYVLIEDHSHGDTTDPRSNLPLQRPAEKPLYSKGPIIIGNNVWLGDKVVILSGVTIGDGAIIGANSVVTHDIPAGAIAAGCPARVIRINNNNEPN